MDENNNEVPVEPTPQSEPGVSEEVSPSEAPTADQYASGFAEISRRERMQHLRDKELKQREATMEAQMREVQEYKQNLELAKQNPQEFLKQAGVDMAEVVGREVAGESPQDLILRRELEAQKQELQDLKTREEQRVAKAEQVRLQGIKNSYVDNIKNWIDNQGDQFELVKQAGAAETVYQVLQNHYNATGGEDLGFEAAAKIVNDHYAEELSRFANTRTLKQMFDASKEAEAPSPAAMDGETEKVPPSVKTLSNTQTAAATSTEPRVLTHHERLQKFANSLKWQ